ncbi:hypothetical protein JCM10908_003583 [Rhodotorula pacifica]|uniref:uncharacterized protein n=1 Tax=Rhodotorula pacifica TaxID=1495444 RepID=UPI0031796BA3
MQDDNPWPRIAALPPLNPRHEFFVNILHAAEGTKEAHDGLVKLVRWIDIKLQKLTLGISEKTPKRPEVTSHKFRELSNEQVHIGTGTATLEHPFKIWLPAYPLKALRMQRFFGGRTSRRSRWCAIPMPPLLEPHDGRVRTVPTTLPGPICAEYTVLGGTRYAYGWPTLALQRLMADRSGLKKSEHWIKDADGNICTFSGLHGVRYQARLYQKDAGNVYFRKNDTNLTVTWSIQFWRVQTDPNIPAEAPVFCIDLRYILAESEPAASARGQEYVPQKRALGERHVEPRDVFKPPLVLRQSV